MAKYNYRTDFVPPAAVVPVKVCSPGVSLGLMLDALVDSGADRTVLPLQVVENLRLPMVDTRLAKGAFDSKPTERKVFAAELTTEFTPSRIVRVFSGEEGYALLGRDILNSCKTLLDGPQQTLEIV